MDMEAAAASSPPSSSSAGGQLVRVDEVEHDPEHGGAHVVDPEPLEAAVPAVLGELGPEHRRAHGEHQPVRVERAAPLHGQRHVRTLPAVQQDPQEPGEVALCWMASSVEFQPQ